jgi:hypothetical protein
MPQMRQTREAGGSPIGQGLEGIAEGGRLARHITNRLSSLRTGSALTATTFSLHCRPASSTCSSNTSFLTLVYLYTIVNPQLPREQLFPAPRTPIRRIADPTASARAHCQWGFVLLGSLPRIFAVIPNSTLHLFAACVCEIHHERIPKDQGRPPCVPSAAKGIRSLSTQPAAGG